MHTANRNPRQGLVVLLIILYVMLTGVLSVSAQAPTPITTSENKTGSVIDPTTSIAYSLSVATPQSAMIQVLAISPGFAPTFRVSAPGGGVIFDAANPGTQTIAQGTPNLSSPGTYIIEVFSANGAPGQFVISVQPSAPLAPPQALTPGQPFNGTVSSQTTRQAFSFTGLTNDILVVIVRSTDAGSGSVVTLRDATTNETLALSTAALFGVSYRLPNVPRSYVLEVTHGGGNASELFTVCLATESGSATCPTSSVLPQGVLPTPTIPPVILPSLTPTFAPAVIDPTGPCMVASARGVTINVRSGPSTDDSIVGQLPPNGTGLVLGRLSDNSWYQVSVNGVNGWVSGSVVIPGGNCAVVSVVTLPPVVNPPVVTEEPMPDVPTSTPTPSIRLDYNQPPVFGSETLNENFRPDPFTTSLTAGGPANVSYLGGGCTGLTTVPPTFRVHYTRGVLPILRFFFLADSGDATMVINGPNGRYSCSDDSFGTTNPTIDFNDPQSGQYDIWVGTYGSGSSTSITGRLIITAGTELHP